MTSTLMTRLCEEHGKLRQLSAEMCELVAQAEPGDLGPLARKRWELASMVHRHLAFEERQVFQRLLADPRPETRTMSERARAAIQQLHAAYKAHVDVWTAEDVIARWPEFQVAVNMLVRHMNIRLGFEEKHLFPLLDRNAELLPTRLPGARNWAGDGVALEAAIKLRPAQSVTPASGRKGLIHSAREAPCTPFAR